jgi:hypothetical protein
MSREDIIIAIKQFFDLEELVCNHTFSKFKTASWQFLDTNFLHALLVIRRDILKKPMYCNNHSAGTYQRGLRCNMCNLVKSKASIYLSSHILGKAGDFTVAGITAEQARQMIKANAHLLPYPIRMEAGVSWLHFDVLPQSGVTQKVYEFRA